MAMSNIPVGDHVTTHFGWSPDFYKNDIRFRWFKPVDLQHSCDETHTYVLERPNGQDLVTSALDLCEDLFSINNMALPFGQIAFLTYHGKGEFLVEATTERYKAVIIESAFRSFGYTDPKLNDTENYLSVSDKDHFLLKLKYGR